MRLTIPRVEARGKYDIVGNVLLLPVRSNGEFWAEFSDITAIIKVYGKEQTRDNDVYMNIEKLGLDFTMKNARFKVKDNLNSQNVLGKFNSILQLTYFQSEQSITMCLSCNLYSSNTSCYFIQFTKRFFFESVCFGNIL